MSTLNAIADPQAPMNKLEGAFAGFLNLKALACGIGHPLYRMNFYASVSTAKKTLPAGIVWCEEAKEVKKGANVYTGRWFVYPWTQKDDDSTPTMIPAFGAVAGAPVAPEVMQDRRLHAIQEMLRDSAAIKAVVNYPGTGNRQVPSFHLFDFHEAEDKHADRQRAFGEALCYEGGFAGYSVR